jgi:hypothetical protein
VTVGVLSFLYQVAEGNGNVRSAATNVAEPSAEEVRDLVG